MSYLKDADAVLDWQVDWSAWLVEDETITASSWTVPDGIEEDSTSNDTTTATIWLSGGTAGTTYTVTNHITTSDGRQDDRSLKIRVTER